MTIPRFVLAPKVTPLPLSQVRRQLSEDSCYWCAIDGQQGIHMYPSLMGSFSCPAPILMIGSSFGEALTSMRSVSFRTSHMEDPWILPTSNTSSEPIVTDVSFPATMVAYQANIGCVAEPSPFSL